MGMDEARAFGHALCNSSVSRVSLLCSMFQCFNFLVGRGHARGMRLGTWSVYAACGVAFVAGVTGAGWRCPKTLYARKQRSGAIQNNNLLLQIASNKDARLQGMKGRGGQTFPKSTEIRNSKFFRAVFSVFFRPNFSKVAESVSEQLLQRTGRLGGQFWLSKESVSTSATDCRISAPICTKYELQKSVHAELMDCTSNVKSLANMYTGFTNFLMGRLWPPKKRWSLLNGAKEAVVLFWRGPKGRHSRLSGPRSCHKAKSNKIIPSRVFGRAGGRRSGG